MRGGCDELNTNSCGIFYHNDNHIFAESREYHYCLSLAFNIVLICFCGMGGKMTKSFDEWFNKSHAVKTAYSASYIVGSRKGYEAGQQSKQAEVDELKREILNKTNEAYADGQKSMRKMIKSNEDELQKRIDEAIYDLQHIESAMWEEQVEHVLRILKGDQ